ncbi:MAG: amidohydrolase family protein [Nitrospinota bacterium]
MVVDVHTHYFPEPYLDLVEREGSRYGVELTRNEAGERELRLNGALHPPLRAFFDVDVRLRDMEAMGVDVQVVHHSSRPNVLFADPGLAAELSRVSNEAYADLVRAHPGRFIGLGVLPLQDMEAALRELERVRALGLSGVMLPSNVKGEYLASERFRPLYEVLNALRMPVFVHPIAPAGVERMRELRMWNGVASPWRPP